MSETPINDLKDKAQEALRNPEDATKKAQNFIQQNKPLLITLGVTFLVLKVNKRMVTKVVRKDSLIIKEHLNQLTAAMEDLSEMAFDKRFADNSFLRAVVDKK